MIIGQSGFLALFVCQSQSNRASANDPTPVRALRLGSALATQNEAALQKNTARLPRRLAETSRIYRCAGYILALNALSPAERAEFQGAEYPSVVHSFGK